MSRHGSRIWFFPDGDIPPPGEREPFGQYALRLPSTVPLVCQIRRMVVRRANLACDTVLGHPGD